MGNMSYLRFVPDSSATVPIDWTKVPETSKEYLLGGWGTDWNAELDDEYDEDDELEDETDEIKEPVQREPIMRQLPMTIGDLGHMLNASKCLGYMPPKLCTLFLDISEFGLKHDAKAPIGPRFYMRSDDYVSFILFMPGERMGIMGNSPYLGDEFTEGEVAKDRALAEEYDLKLCKEYQRISYAGVITTKKIAGWQASMLKHVLEKSQLNEAMLTLPFDHPVFMAYIEDDIRSLQRSRVPQI